MNDHAPRRKGPPRPPGAAGASSRRPDDRGPAPRRPDDRSGARGPDRGFERGPDRGFDRGFDRGPDRRGPPTGRGPDRSAQGGRPRPFDDDRAPIRPVRRDLRPVLFMPCAMGVEPLLVEELTPLLAALKLQVLEEKGGVLVRSAEGDGRAPIDLAFDLGSPLAATLIEACALVNLHSRLAQRVLWRVAFGPYSTEDQLYQLGRCVIWPEWMRVDQTLRVDVTARHSPLKSLNFAALRIKDAVCDSLREELGERPDVDTRHPDLPLHLHLDGQAAHVYVDTSGEALFKRGWREDKGEAPLKETLAAAMLAAAGWKGREGDGTLLDPCCGSGTIAIEAAQIACGIAPGLQRRFAFEKLLPFQPHLARWQQLRQQARAQQHPPRVRIVTGDVSFRMTDFATRNAERAGVTHAIEFKTADALQRPAPDETGVMMFNPPYGERIDPKGTGAGGRTTALSADAEQAPRAPRAPREDFIDRDASDFFQRLSSHWKKQYSGWTAWVLSPDMKLPSAMRLKESRRVVMFNGPIECRLFRFDLVKGSLRNDAPATAPASDNSASTDD